MSGPENSTWYTALSHNFPTNKKSKMSSSNKCNKIFGQSCREHFERQTKATLEVKTRHFVMTFKPG